MREAKESDRQSAKNNEAKNNESGAKAAGERAKSNELAKLERIIALLEKSSLVELSYEDSDIAVRLSKASTAHAPVVMSHVASHSSDNARPAPASASDTASPAPSSEPLAGHVTRSPFVGTFYRAPSPNDPPFVEVGQQVVRGQTLCIVEAMKLMNEIESEVDGTVLEICPENGKPVQYGDALFRIAPRK